MKTLKNWSLLMTLVGILGFAQNDPMIFRINFPETKMAWGYSGTDNFEYTTQKVGGTVISENKTGTNSLEVDAPGEYLISIVPPSNLVSFNNSALSSTSKSLVLELLQWGDIKWASMESLFNDFTKLTISATDIPDISSVKSFNGLFENTSRLTKVPNINNWDTSQVTDMSEMFTWASSFNQPLDFNTSNVTDMSLMFYGASEFNQSLNFDTSNVTDMSYMFTTASSFNQPLYFDTSKVTDMSGMFLDASAFNQSLSFNTSNVISMYNMFAFASSFNQLLNFDTINVISMDGMFWNARSFNQLLNFNTSKVTSMIMMFFVALDFNQPLNFDTSNVINMSRMFASAISFNQPLTFNTSNVTDISGMFLGASSFNQMLNFNTSKVSEMYSMFSKATSFNQDTGQFQLASNVNLAEYAENSNIDCKNYSTTLKGWASQSDVPINRIVSFGKTEYGKEGETYRNLLIDKGWKIIDGGLNEDCEKSLSLDPMDLNKKVSLYHNPTSDLVYFTTDKASDVKIFSAEGRLVKSLKSKIGHNTVDVSNLGGGIYFITIGNHTQKLMKK